MAFSIPAVSLIATDALSLLAGSLPVPWGIYLDGIPVVLADTVGQFDFQQAYQISTFPVERGAFQSYDKVYTPFKARFRFAAGGSELKRQALLDSIKAIVGDTNVYDIVTPDSVYLGVNVVSLDYVQSASDGIGMLVADVGTEQVLTASSPILSAVISPSSASQINGGPVQPLAATATQQSFLSKIVGLF